MQARQYVLGFIMISIGILSLALLLPLPAEARTWVVHADSTGDAPSIQAGVDSAAAGDTVSVTPGSYTDIHSGVAGYSVVDMKPGVTLLSTGGPAQTTIDATSAFEARGVVLANCDAATVVAGFTITGGDGFNGGGVWIEGGAPLIRGNILSHNAGGTGGGLYMTGSAAKIIDNKFDQNEACCGVGGAIMVKNGSAPDILDNEFTGNTGFGGGAVAFFSASGRLEGNTFAGNGGTDGGALMVRDSDPLVKDNTFLDNHSTTNGGAVFFRSAPGSRFEGNLVVENTADGSGGGIAINGASPEMIRNTVARNSASQGGGVYVTGISAPIFDRMLIVFNTGPGGVLCDSPLVSATFACCNTYGNEGIQYDGFCPDQTGTSGNTSEDPLFCEGCYYLSDCSPLTVHYDCSQVGALGVGCECGGASHTEPATWGAIKSIFK